MAKQKKEKRGGPGRNQGRKPDPVKKKKLTVSVPVKDYETIKSKVKKLGKAYEEKCRREL